MPRALPLCEGRQAGRQAGSQPASQPASQPFARRGVMSTGWQAKQASSVDRRSGRVRGRRCAIALLAQPTTNPRQHQTHHLFFCRRSSRSASTTTRSRPTPSRSRRVVPQQNAQRAHAHAHAKEGGGGGPGPHALVAGAASREPLVSHIPQRAFSICCVCSNQRPQLSPRCQ